MDQASQLTDADAARRAVVLATLAQLVRRYSLAAGERFAPGTSGVRVLCAAVLHNRL